MCNLDFKENDLEGKAITEYRLKIKPSIGDGFIFSLDLCLESKT